MIKTIFYKNTSCPKENQYNWVGIVDKNGRMLKDILIPQASEFFNHVYESSISASDVLLDEDMYNIGCNKKMKRFFKVVSPRLWEEYFKPVKRARGRYKKENIYVHQTFYDAFHNSETFYKNSILWMICSLEVLHDWMPYIDSCRIMRVNNDFVEMFGEEHLYQWSFDEIIEGKFAKLDSIKSETSEKIKARLARKNTTIQPREEILDNGMMLVHETEFIEAKKTEIPEIYDYCFVRYRRLPETSESTPKPEKKVSARRRFTDPNSRVDYRKITR